MDANKPRILVVHRDRASSQALVCAIGRTVETDEIAAAACENASGIGIHVRDFRPDILILNVLGFEFSAVLQCLHDSASHARVMVCGLRCCGAEILASIQEGADACETIDGSLEDLTAHVLALSRGETVCPPSVARILFHEVATGSGGQRRGTERDSPQLTRRERQIVSLVERGLSNKQIANELSIGLQTAKNHVHNILEKLQLRGRTEAARYARDHGLLIDPATIGTRTSTPPQR